eukprot:UN23818
MGSCFCCRQNKSKKDETQPLILNNDSEPYTKPPKQPKITKKVSIDINILIKDEIKNNSINMIQTYRSIRSELLEYFNSDTKSNSIITVIIEYMFNVVNLLDFHNIELVGRGGFSQVYYVEHKHLPTDNIYALKMMDKSDKAVQRRKKLIHSEVDTLSKLQECPFILNLKCSFETLNYYCLLTEFLPGGDLWNLKRRIGSLSEKHVQFY